MGNSQSSSRILELDDIEAHLTQCTQLSTKNCTVYGNLHYLRYQTMEFYLGKSVSQQPPSQLYLHYLIPPNLLVIPSMTLLEQTKPENYEQLLQLMSGISKFLKDQQEVYVGRGRIGYANRWGLIGEKPDNWPYKQVLKDRNSKGVYLSPTLIQQLSQQKASPTHDPVKSDIFALGIMLVEIIFCEDLSNLFNYATYEIILKPLLQKLSIIRKEFGQQLYCILLKMLQLQESDRIDFNGFHSAVSRLNQRNINSDSASHSSRKRPVTSHLHINGYPNQSSRNRSPRLYNKSPPQRVVSPQQLKYKSPFRKDLRINVLYGQNRSPKVNNRSPLSTKRASFNIMSKR